MRDSIEFKVVEFKPKVKSALNVHDALQQKKFIAVRGEFDVSAVVQVLGRNDREAAMWEIGFTQTVFKSIRWLHYFDAVDRPIYKRFDEVRPVPAFDGQAQHAPFYSPATRVQKIGVNVKVKAFDWPTGGGPYWTKDGFGVLKKVDGTDEFVIWLIARHRGNRQIKFLSWARWSVKFDTEVNATTHSGRSKGGRGELRGKGAGRGNSRPELVRARHEIEGWHALRDGSWCTLVKEPTR